MGRITSKDNTLYWTIQRNVTETVTIIKSNGWLYDEILMDFKQDKDINDFAIKSLTVGNGLTVNGNNLTITLSYEETTLLNQTRLYADIKLRLGSSVIPPIPMIITINQTVTKVL